MNTFRNLSRVLLVLWAGSLWSLGAWVAWVLFGQQPDRHLAGILVGRLFSIEAYLGLAVALTALVLPGRGRYLWVYAAAALLAVNEWLLRRLMGEAHVRGAAYGLTFGAWHGVSAALYAMACLAVVLFVWKEDFR